MSATRAEVDRLNACLAEVTTRVVAGLDVDGDVTFRLVGPPPWTYDDDAHLAKALHVSGTQVVCTDCFMVNASMGKEPRDPRYDAHAHCGACPPRPNEEPCCT